MTTHIHDPEPYAAHVLTGEGAAVRNLRLRIARIAPHFRIALVTGEPGVGHQAVARHLHLASPVAHQDFIAIPSSDFPHTVPEPKGTVYLDGVEALLPAAQAKLLRALKLLDRETRVVVGSNSNLKGMVSTGRLRNDLYETIGMLEIGVAPLRDRRDDLEFLAAAMLATRATGPALTSAAARRLRDHTWPGNLEELWRLCQRLAPLRRAIEPSDLSWPDAPSPSPFETVRLEDVMHRHVMDVLQGCSGNKLRAAELLGISRSTLYRMLDSAA